MPFEPLDVKQTRKTDSEGNVICTEPKSSSTKDNSRLVPVQSFYRDLPSGYMTLQDFENEAVKRLKVLKILEMSRLMNKPSSDVMKQIEQIGGCQYFCSATWNMTATDKMEDLHSHHILRLAYCKAETKRQWLVEQEVDLLRFRLRCLGDSDSYIRQQKLKEILALNNLTDASMSIEEPDEELMEKLNCLAVAPKSHRLYKVKFEEVPQLVRARRVVVYDGYAILTTEELLPFILGKYKLHLKEQMALIVARLPYVDEDSRLIPLLSALSGGDLGAAYSTSSRDSSDKISLVDLDKLSLTAFPLCMQALHSHLKTRHHMKHDGRMQYGLFLKGAGLSLEDSLIFWRNEFSNGGVDPEKFDKLYAYNVRHNYGKEGKRTNYTPHSCMKIISNTAPKGDECHGCPIKHSDEASLRTLLERRKLSVEAVEEIVKYKQLGHFQVACMSVFKHGHGGNELINGLQHPNQYFDESRKLSSAANSQSNSSSQPNSTTQTSQGNNQIKPSQVTPDNDFLDMLTDDME